jgi:hypothetical protein
MSKTRLRSRRLRVSLSSSARGNRRANTRRRSAAGSWNSAKVLKPALWTLFALVAGVAACAIWFKAAHKLRPRASGSKAAVGSPQLTTKNTSTSIQSSNGGGPLSTPSRPEPSAKPVNQEPAIAKNPIDRNLPTPTPSSPTITNLESPDGNGKAPEQRATETPEQNVEKGSGKKRFKTLEKERREAEQKRHRLEDMYQKGLITTKAYRDGQAEYQSKIEKYRKEAISGKETGQ